MKSVSWNRVFLSVPLASVAIYRRVNEIIHAQWKLILDKLYPICYAIRSRYIRYRYKYGSLVTNGESPITIDQHRRYVWHKRLIFPMGFSR